MTHPAEQKKKGLLDGMFSNPSDTQRMAMIQMGLSMLGPQRAGSSTIQNLAGAGVQGLNYLGRVEKQRADAKRASEKAKVDARLSGARAGELEATTSNQGRVLDQTDRGNQIKAYNALTQRGQVELVYKQALLKAKSSRNEFKEKIMLKLIDQDIERIKQGGKADPFGVMSTFKVFMNAGFTFDRFDYDPKSGMFIVDSNITDAQDEDGNHVTSFLYLTAEEVIAMGGNPKLIMKFYEARQAQFAQETKDFNAQGTGEPVSLPANTADGFIAEESDAVPPPYIPTTDPNDMIGLPDEASGSTAKESIPDVVAASKNLTPLQQANQDNADALASKFKTAYAEGKTKLEDAESGKRFAKSLIKIIGFREAGMNRPFSSKEASKIMTWAKKNLKSLSTAELAGFRLYIQRRLSRTQQTELDDLG